MYGAPTPYGLPAVVDEIFVRSIFSTLKVYLSGTGDGGEDLLEVIACGEVEERDYALEEVREVVVLCEGELYEDLPEQVHSQDAEHVDEKEEEAPQVYYCWQGCY